MHWTLKQSVSTVVKRIWPLGILIKVINSTAT